MRVLVVDDEVDLAEAVATGLRREGYAVDLAHDGGAALEKVALAPYDVVVLDLTMPGLDGLEVCRRIRAGEAAEPPPRVLMLTARDTVEDRVAGLDEGADDYLVKPFAFAELSARIRSLARRDPRSSGALVRVGDLEVDESRRIARRGGRELALTPKEFGVLRYLAHRPGVVVSQEELLEHVWDERADPFTDTVRVTVGTLRRKLDPNGDAPLIDTVVGAGYRLREPA